MAAITESHMSFNRRSLFQTSLFGSSCKTPRAAPLICSPQFPKIRMEAQDLAKQMKEMATARRRWESQVREGKVKVLTPKEAGYTIQLSDKVLLDVRPSIERRKACVKDSIWIPIFDVDKKLDLETLLKKISNFTMGGWWSGIALMAYNDKFIRQVEEKISKDTDIVVSCQSGISFTDQQRYAAKKEGWGYRAMFFSRLVAIILLVDALFIGVQQLQRTVR
ncbi:rhodanese-like domain-containing protein 11, chloroplastic isoform X2 [Cryptomeria japonica]|uniref:rhodanese-like domain-containing protein 11, chloroplastic isoform X2 n=1 Tax=Cryptomeria japonica TaxID=3369 RepID=UPI0025AC9785|nr:rhodanese-like domain-containing protein 11, chloroplastic isoform X2 [Cryptomeria japonica]